MAEASPASGEGAAGRRDREFTAFYHANLDAVRGYVRSRSVAVDVDAISNEAMARVYEKWEELTGSPRAWAFRVAGNLVVSDLRRRRQVSTDPANLPEVEPYRFAGPEDSYELVAVREAIARLPEHLQEPIRLAAQQLPAREIAMVLNLSPRTVSSYLRRARVLLHELVLSDAGSEVASEPEEGPVDGAESPREGAEQPRVAPGVDPHHGQEDR